MVLLELSILTELLKAYNGTLKKVKKGRFIRPFFYLILMLPCVLQAQSVASLYVQFESSSYSPATSLSSISGRWNDEVSSGNKAWSINRLSLGYQQSGYTFEAIYRADFNYAFHNETVQFLYLSNNQLALETNRDYSLFIRPDKLAARGLRLGFSVKPTDSINVQTFLSVLQATDVLDGSLSGGATALASNDFNFNFSSDLIYKNDPLFGRKTTGLSGRGYALDVFINYQFNEVLSFNAQLIDLAGEMTFDAVPFTQATATSDVKSFDDGGYVQYNPSVSGVDGEKRVVKKLKGRQKLSALYHISNDKTLVFEHYNVFGFKYQKYALQQQYGQYDVTLSVLPRLNALGVQFKQDYYSIGLETDHIKRNKIKYLMLNAQLKWIF